MGKQATRRILETHSEVVLRNHWLEAFWCEECQDVKWYYIYKNDRTYRVSTPPNDIWRRVVGVGYPRGNPSVSEFTLRQSRNPGYLMKRFRHNS